MNENDTQPLSPPNSLSQRLKQNSAKVIAIVGPSPASARVLFALRPMLLSLMLSSAAALALSGGFFANIAPSVTPSVMPVSNQIQPKVAPTDSEVPLFSLMPQGSFESSVLNPHPHSLGQDFLVSSKKPLSPETLFANQLKQLPSSLVGQPLAEYLLVHHDPFLALATTIESLPTHPYWDGGGLNVGIGYCVTQRRHEKGDLVVKDDLKQAGFSDDVIKILMDGTRAQQAKIEFSSMQALRLLQHVGKEYREIARVNIGSKVFDDLSNNRQATLTWLAYNTGPKGFPQFHRLIHSIQNSKHEEALRHLTPFYSEGGKFLPNARAGTTIMAAYASPVGLKYAISHPDSLQSAAQEGTSPVKKADPKLKIKSPPPSPFDGLKSSSVPNSIKPMDDFKNRLGERRQEAMPLIRPSSNLS